LPESGYPDGGINPALQHLFPEQAVVSGLKIVGGDQATEIRENNEIEVG
jgi:hypothetical protein